MKFGYLMKNLRPKMILIMGFACTREVIQKSLNQNSSKLRDFVQAFGPILLVSVGSQHSVQKVRNYILLGKKVISLAYIFTMEKLLV